MAGSSSGGPVGSAATDDPAVVGVIRWCSYPLPGLPLLRHWACLSDYQLPFLLPNFSHRVNSRLNSMLWIAGFVVLHFLYGLSHPIRCLPYPLCPDASAQYSS